MVSAISEIALDSIVLQGKDTVKKVSGKLAGAYKPGQAVTQTAADTWTETAGTSSHARMSCGWIEFKKRTSLTFGEVSINDAYTQYTKTNVEIIIGPKNGTVKLAVFTKDLSGSMYYGEVLTAHSSGALQLWEEDTTFNQVAMITEDGYSATDTVAKVYMI